MSSFEEVTKQKVPMIYFVPLRVLTGISWLIWSILIFGGVRDLLGLSPVFDLSTLLLPAVVALIAGILLVIGLFTKLGAFLTTLLAYISYFGLATISPTFSQLYFGNWPLLFSGIALMFWNTGRVLGLDKYVVAKAPFFAKIHFS